MPRLTAQSNERFRRQQLRRTGAVSGVIPTSRQLLGMVTPVTRSDRLRPFGTFVLLAARGCAVLRYPRWQFGALFGALFGAVRCSLGWRFGERSVGAFGSRTVSAELRQICSHALGSRSTDDRQGLECARLPPNRDRTFIGHSVVNRAPPSAHRRRRASERTMVAAARGSQITC